MGQRADFVELSEQFIRNRKTWSEALESTGFLPAFLTVIIRIGETTGTLDVVLLKIAAVYQKELEWALERG